MPVAYNSPARNMFFLGASNQQTLTSFLRRITTTSTSETYRYEPARIEFEPTDQKYLISGSQLDGADSLYEGFLTKITESGSKAFDIKLQSTETTAYGTTIRSITQDTVGNIIVCGRKGEKAVDNAGSPYVGKFSSTGIPIWFVSMSEVSTTSLVEYTSICVDSSNDIYAVGYDTTNENNNTILTKISSSGSIQWNKKLLDSGTNGFGDFGFRNISINLNNQLILSGTIEGKTRIKGAVAKYTTSGNQIWIKTFEDKSLATSSSYRDVIINSSFVDGKGIIYCVGTTRDNIAVETEGIAFALSKEGNIIWQSKTNSPYNTEFTSVSADTLTGQMVVAGSVWTGSQGYTIARRYDSYGRVLWTRKISSTNARSAYVNLTSDPSYYYIMFADKTQGGADPESFLYGKLSITGNGLGVFTYNDSVLNQDYTIITIGTKTGTLVDGSLRNDVSDFVTYPHNPVKIMFDDLSMIFQPKNPVHDGSDHNIAISGTDITSISPQQYPKISSDSIVYDSNLLLNYDFKNRATYPLTGTTINNLSSSSYAGSTTAGPAFNFGGYFQFGSGSYLTSGYTPPVSTFTFLIWYKKIDSGYWSPIISCEVWNNSTGYLLYLSNSTTLSFTKGGTAAGVSATVSDVTGWCHYAVTLNSSAAVSLYRNGTALTTSGSVTLASSVTNPILLGARYQNAGTGITDSVSVHIGEVQAYNKVLTSTEVSQNFNATRAKYGV